MSDHPVDREIRRIESDLKEAEEIRAKWENQLKDFDKEIARLKRRHKALSGDKEKLRVKA